MFNKKGSKGKRLIWEYTEAIVTALLLALVIRAYVVQAFKIPTGSMKSTLLVGDHILVNKFMYGFDIPFTGQKMLAISDPVREDIVVFKYPEDPKRDFIKRIIGTEGDVVESKDKVIYINGKAVDEPYAEHVDPEIRPRGIDPRDNFGPILVPSGKYFMMGDNRDQSYDSRYWGFVDRDKIRGRAFIIYWSWNGQNKLPRIGRMGDLVN